MNLFFIFAVLLFSPYPYALSVQRAALGTSL